MTLQLPQVWFFGIFSAALLLSGLLGPLAGRMIDKHGGRDVLAATNLVFAAGLVCLSFASGIGSLALAWALIGIGMGFGLYEAAFATAAGLYGREARNAITGITLVRRFRQHGRLAGECVVHRTFWLARGLRRLGSAASRHRPADEPAADPENRAACSRRQRRSMRHRPAFPGR